ncbi:type II and III secretion system protein family protein [Thauera mechernichensis]|uniref:Type II and III secretion system protein family protein n=1 Tax=Thauera mechernichensis TaxID=82788 RepID=A0ABW3WG39_9RHOO|nr:pilus assembly protein N-terminal domain-containing protein [Thauera mechernichensis]MDG3064642.1 pilus assembly protein N-terminal domain-containing protein [Thauera mechernichensis]
MHFLTHTLLRLFALCCLTTAAASAAPATASASRSAEMPELTLFQGETRVITEPNVGRLAVGNGKALSAAVLDEREILLIANEIGTSSLHIWTANGRNRRLKVTVVAAETPRVNREIAAFLADIPNARSTVIGDRIVIEGDNLSNRDQARIEALAKHYPQILNFANPVGWEKMIVMEVQIAEFPVNMLREVGLAWTATGGAAIGGIWMPGRRGNTPLQIDVRTGAENAPPIVSPDGSGNPVPLGSSLNVLSALNAGLNAQLRLMEQNGSASILAQPILSTRSGAEASFLAGGEFPYSVSNINGTTIQFKPYGIRLEISPTVDHNGVIRARIMSEVSDLDPSVMSAAGPALRTRKTETEFNVMDGGTIVLSGLLSRDVNASIDKVPLLGDIPVLGALFRSRRFQNNETELVVFVTPYAVDRHTLQQAESMLRARQRLEDAPRAPEPDLSAIPWPAAPVEDRPIPGTHDPLYN